jgi:RNA polymerase sigma-70 factor, ECF subfamily
LVGERSDAEPTTRVTPKISCHAAFFQASNATGSVVNGTDDEMVALALTGQPAAFAQLVQRHSRTVYRVALRMTGSATDAEDVLQETFLQVHKKLDTFLHDAKFSTWLYSIATNAALMQLRARRSRPVERPLADYLPQFDETGTYARLDVDYSCAARADVVVENRQLARAALEFVAELPELYRVPFVLRDLEELDTEETAAILGVDVDLVRQRVHRARLMLRARLTKLVGADS